MGVFHVFLNCTNGTKSRKASHLVFWSILEYQVLKKAHLARHPYVSKKIITSGKPQVYDLVMSFDFLLNIKLPYILGDGRSVFWKGHVMKLLYFLVEHFN